MDADDDEQGRRTTDIIIYKYMCIYIYIIYIYMYMNIFVFFTALEESPAGQLARDGKRSSREKGESRCS